MSGRGRAVRMLEFGPEVRRFESHTGIDWKILTVHPAVNEYLTIVGEGLS